MSKRLKKEKLSETAPSLGLDLVPPARARRRRKADPAGLGATLAAIRVAAGMTQDELAAGADVGVSSVRKIEQGDVGVNLKTVLRLVHFLDRDLAIVPKAGGAVGPSKAPSFPAARGSR
jgi:DNA-binding XRE family transcriptional regulator